MMKLISDKMHKELMKRAGEGKTLSDLIQGLVETASARKRGICGKAYR